ncbi:Zinc finger protein 862 [Acropora cervicornis]|uniref:Zinc finger protein 862 n=1 Tax=Acropora cervicornis TaxID=6130 RepID=A0AAD9QND6_ACRCE|nr:Zinc finger protein 862 [Acropora cervicornis]
MASAPKKPRQTLLSTFFHPSSSEQSKEREGSVDNTSLPVGSLASELEVTDSSNGGGCNESTLQTGEAHVEVAAAPVDTVNKPTHRSNKSVPTCRAIELISQYFQESPQLHYFYKCKEGCNKSCDGRFKHEWILDRGVGYCEKTGLWWLVYEEGNGMFCLLCRMHDCENPFNHQKKFNQVPAIRFKKSALIGKDGHSGSQQHEIAIQREVNKRVSFFHKEFETQLQTKDSALHHAVMSAYWLAKEEIANRKFTSLLELEEILGVSEIKRFAHRSQGSQRELFLLLGQALKDEMLMKVKNADSYGLMVDEATDVSVVEQLISFIQFANPETGAPEVHFLSIQNVLESSTSANSATIVKLIKEELSNDGLDITKLGSLASDGVSVMTGSRNGVAAKLRETVPTLINIHCICHRLALACNDANDNLTHISQVETVLRQLWSFFENSAARSAVYVQTSCEMKKLDSMSEKSKEKLATKVQKACRTRWLSLDKSVESVCRNLPALLQTLRWYQNKDSNPTAIGLLKKLKKPDFIGVLYILKGILPVLSILSKVFQKGSISFSRISPAIKASKDSLNKLVQENITVKEFRKETTTGKLACLEFSEDEITKTEAKMHDLCSQYVTALTDNIDQRFQHSLPVVSSFRIFDPLSMPIANPDGDENSSKRLKLEAEWNNFKYELSDWSKDYQAIPSPSATSTEWALQRFLRHKESYSRSYPLLLQVAEICLSMPVSNALPERGASALERLKTRLGNSLKKEMLESLLHIAINGPPVKESEAVINKAVELWKEKKKRKKLSCLQQPNAQNAQNNQDEVEEGEEEGGGGPSCSTREQEEELEEELAKELDLSLSSDSAFESDMDY